MFDYSTIKLMHNHGGGEWAPMEPGQEHSPAAHDPERAWLKGARIWKCSRCEDEIAVEIPPQTNDHPFTGG